MIRIAVLIGLFCSAAVASAACPVCCGDECRRPAAGVESVPDLAPHGACATCTRCAAGAERHVLKTVNGQPVRNFGRLTLRGVGQVAHRVGHAVGRVGVGVLRVVLPPYPRVRGALQRVGHRIHAGLCHRGCG